MIYAGFIAFVLAMLFIDLRILHARATLPSVRRSGAWVAVWVALAVAFGAFVTVWRGPNAGGEYFAGYLIEYALSVDNMFVFLLIFTYFKVPQQHQHRVLFLGILGALIFRGTFIAAGAALLNALDWMIYVFGAVLIYTAIRVARGAADVDPEHNPVLKLFRRRFRTSTAYDGDRFFTIDNGKRVATPLLVVLLIIETTDIVFAVDSIPAIFAITTDPFIVLTSNVFAVLGLRALYFLLAGGMARFHLLKYGLALILGGVGLKMLATEIWHPPIWVSLAFIVGVLGVTVFASLRFPPRVTREPLPDPSTNPFLGGSDPR